MHPWEHPSNIHTAAFNIRQLYVRQRDIPSTLHSSTRPSINFHQLVVCPWKTFCAETGPSAYIQDNFQCGCVTFRQLSVSLWYHPSSFSATAGNSVNVLCVCRTFCKPMCTLRADEEPSYNFPCDHRTFSKCPLTFVPSRELLLTFRAIVGPSATFSQLSEWSPVFLPTFVNFA